MARNFLDDFILVEYNGLSYPEGYSAQICEVAAHFDKENIEPKTAYSLHTEYSYGKRKFDTQRIAKFPTLSEANKEGVPQLWKSTEWADAFADFLISLIEDHMAPTIIEIHPPFNDYCTLSEFAERYRVFEEKIHRVYPDVIIVIENRAGSVYHGGRFLVGKAREIVALCELIKTENLKLGIVLDFPQLLTAENIDPGAFKIEKYQKVIEAILPYQELISGIHIWGKRKDKRNIRRPHMGDLNTYFDGNEIVKKEFLGGIYKICNDGKLRFLVPEVNYSKEDLMSILQDLCKL